MESQVLSERNVGQNPRGNWEVNFPSGAELVKTFCDEIWSGVWPRWLCAEYVTCCDTANVMYKNSLKYKTEE